MITMMTGILNQFLIGLLLVILTGFPMAHGQEEQGGLYVSGKITTEQGSVNGAYIRMTCNGRELNDYQVLPDGKFNLRFEFNNHYELVFTRKENFSQRITVNTLVPKEVLRRDRKFPPFPLDIHLYTEVAGVDKSFAENTTLKIYYSGSVDNFIPEVYYNSAQIKRLVEQAIWQAQNVSRESDLLKRLTAAELAQMRKEYDALLKNAGVEFDKGDYLASLDHYESATRIFPKEQYPKDRIAEIRDLIGVLGLQAELDKRTEEKYNRLVKLGDQNFNTGDFAIARTHFGQALAIRPGDAYASGKIEAIARAEAEAGKNQRYGSLISLADNAMKEMLWDEAKNRYREAAGLKPGESYPATQIARIESILQELAMNAEKQANFNSAVLNGDASYAKQFYSKAIAFYENALTYKPGDEEVLAKIADIEKEQKKIADNLWYDETIASADKAFEKKEYRQAKELYLAAMTARPGQTYPGKQVESIDQILRDFDRYDQLILTADDHFSRQDYATAAENYKKALEIKPGESYPVGKIKEIELVIAARNRAEQQYRQLIAAADKLFGEKRLALARAEYQKALTQKPGDSHPVSMLEKIAALEEEEARQAREREDAERARLLSEREQRLRQYEELVGEADRLAGRKELVEAVGKFRAALELMPQESYPIQRIEEIRGIISRQAAARKAYEAAVAEGDRTFRTRQYDAARAAFVTAREALPDEPYPAEMLARIDSAEAEAARLEAEKLAAAETARLAALRDKEQQYGAYLSVADSLFNRKQYASALTGYRSALKVKPEETYPQQRIADCERITAELAAARKAYEAAVAEGDRTFRTRQYDAARAAFITAREALPDEPYPAEMLAKIDSAEAEAARLEAEKLAAAETARLAIRRKYESLIRDADQAQAANQPDEAEKGYREALTLLPGESYPEEQLGKIRTMRAALLDRQFAERMAAGDRHLEEERFDEAETNFREAEKLKPEEESVILKLEETAQRRQAELAALREADKLNKDYIRLISLADKAFDSGSYTEAGSNYREAQKLKPEENHPAVRILEVDSILEQRDNDNRYRSLLLAADAAYKLRDWEPARESYGKALEIKPDEAYPRKQISEIDEILARRAQQSRPAEPPVSATSAAVGSSTAALPPGQAEKKYTDETEALYSSIIATADLYFTGKSYNVSRAWYYKALEVKPGEAYPSGRIAEINGILGSMQLSQQDREFQDNIDKGDEAFHGGQMAVARSWYNRALGLRPGDSYPREQLSEIQMKINERLQGNTEKTVAGYLEKGDEALAGKEYNIARVWYQRALQLKPGDPVAVEKLESLRKAVAGEGGN